jgi:hypothetical protein
MDAVVWLKKKFGEQRERERKNPSTYLTLIDYIKAYDNADRGNKCKKNCRVFGEL